MLLGTIWLRGLTLLVNVLRLQRALLLADSANDLREHGAAAGRARTLVGFIFGVAEIVIVVTVKEAARFYRGEQVSGQGGILEGQILGGMAGQTVRFFS